MLVFNNTCFSRNGFDVGVRVIEPYWQALDQSTDDVDLIASYFGLHLTDVLGEGIADRKPVVRRLVSAGKGSDCRNISIAMSPERALDARNPARVSAIDSAFQMAGSSSTSNTWVSWPTINPPLL